MRYLPQIQPRARSVGFRDISPGRIAASDSQFQISAQPRSGTRFGRNGATGGADAFRAEANVFSRRSVVLADDICTTGTTLVACTEAWRAARVTQVWAVTLARAARR